METKCMFCGKKRKGKEVSYNDWVSDIHLVNIVTKSVMQKVTVCPKCRETHTISKLYGG